MEEWKKTNEKLKATIVDTYFFAKRIAKLYQQGEKIDWLKAKKIAKDYKVETDTEIMQACELGCVIEAHRIAQNGNSLAQQYEEMKDLYERQVNIKPLDTKSKVLNQYSTPCPLAYLLGTFVNQNHKMNEGKILEPSAGNGLLTTVFNPKDVCVNELDEIRVENLRKLGFYNVKNIDASEKALLDNEYQDKSFRGIITNPPFAKLPTEKKIQRNGWEINTLDYKMAVLALDKMNDNGRASIIVGGKMWNAYWKPLSETSQKQVLFGQWKTFLGYLYAQYNVVDVIYVDGDNIYRKQGTQYPITIILIDGRHKYDESNKPRYVFDPDKDVIIQTYDQLFDRMCQHISSVQTTDDEAKRKRAKALMLKMKMAKAKIAEAEHNNSVENLDGTAKDSISINFNKELLKYKQGILKNTDKIYVCNTPEFWKQKGFLDKKIFLPVSVLDKATKDKHHLLVEHFVNFPDILRLENEFFVSKTTPNAYVQLTSLYDIKNNPITVAIHLKEKDGKLKIYKIASVYGRVKRQIENWRKEGLNI